MDAVVKEVCPRRDYGEGIKISVSPENESIFYLLFTK